MRKKTLLVGLFIAVFSLFVFSGNQAEAAVTTETSTVTLQNGEQFTSQKYLYSDNTHVSQISYSVKTYTYNPENFVVELNNQRGLQIFKYVCLDTADTDAVGYFLYYMNQFAQPEWTNFTLTNLSASPVTYEITCQIDISN